MRFSPTCAPPLILVKGGPQAKRKTQTTMKESKKTKTKKCLKSKKNEIKHSPDQPKRLDFLRALLRASGITLNELADHFGVSRVTVGYWFRIDDMHISLIRRICEYCGYDFELSLCHSAYEREEPVLHLGRRAMQYERRSLPFLCIAMARDHISSQDIADRLGICYSTVHRWFDANDMYLSRIVTVAEAFDLSIRIIVRPLDAHRYAGERASRVEYRPLVFDNPLQ